MAKRLKILASVKVACRESWDDRREIFQVSWLVILLSFLLLALQMFFPALKLPCRVAGKLLFSVIAVCLFRKYILGEKPEIKKLANISFYLRFGRREGLYALWTAVLMLLAFLFGRAASLAENLPFLGPFVAELVWPMLRDLLLAMLILVRPYIAVAPKPAADDVSGLIEAVIGNIVHILMAVNLVIFLPYYIMTAVFHFGLIPGFHAAWHYAEHAVFCAGTIIEIKFAGNVYKDLYTGRARAR